MSLLAFNAGSSSLKFALFETAGGGLRRSADGLVQEIGGPCPRSRLRRADGEAGPAADREAAAPDHAAAAALCLAWLDGERLGDGIAATAHRVVHGGRSFTGPTLVDAGVLRRIDDLRQLAPLHNGPSLAALRAVGDVLGPETPAVVSFDTALHAQMPDRASRYAIDPELADRHDVRRYGFHGLAHRSMLRRYARHAVCDPAHLRVVTFQLGNGCSAAALDHGRSVDTTMGLTPLEGLVMGTRSGDVDPALVGYLARRQGVDTAEVEEWLNRRSGLLGLSGRSSDMRELLAAESAGDRRAGLAIDVFCHRVRKAVGAFLAVLGGADAIVFGGGIGAGSPDVRARACAGLEALGIALDPVANCALAGEGMVSAPGSRTAVFVAAVDEELELAAEAAGVIGRSAAA